MLNWNSITSTSFVHMDIEIFLTHLLNKYLYSSTMQKKKKNSYSMQKMSKIIQ